MAQTVEVCSARGTRTSERRGRPIRQVTVTAERLFNAASYGHVVLGLEEAGPRVTMSRLVETGSAVNDVRRREVMAPSGPLVRSSGR